MQYKVFFNPNESTASRGLVRGSGNQEVILKRRWADTADLFESKKSSKKRVREDRDAATQIISSLRRLSVCTSAAARNPEGFSAYMEGFGFSPEELEGIEELLDEIYVNWSENAD